MNCPTKSTRTPAAISTLVHSARGNESGGNLRPAENDIQPMTPMPSRSGNSQARRSAAGEVGTAAATGAGGAALISAFSTFTWPAVSSRERQ